MNLCDITGEPTNGYQSKDVIITGLTADSRSVCPGYLFAALNGTNTRGEDYIPEALRLGAIAVLAPPGTSIKKTSFRQTYLITDDNPRRRFAKMAARFFGRQPKIISAVTGTNGKTSTVSFLREIWRLQHLHAASLGSLGVEYGSKIDSLNGMTTPEPELLHRTLAKLEQSGVTHCALEASSHGLDQHRLDGVGIRSGAFLNISHDHMDYHKDWTAYKKAKERLFGEVIEAGSDAVLNIDDVQIKSFVTICKQRKHHIIFFGRNKGDIKLLAHRSNKFKQYVSIDLLGQKYDLELPFPGIFQVYNLLAAVGLAIVNGMSPSDVVRNIPRLSSVKGRLELIAQTSTGAHIFVDYAHTPDALLAALKSLRLNLKGRLIVLFGCGGNRDTEKRPQMGQIASDLADVSIITDDNPRFEAPETIRKEVLEACPNGIEIEDRGKAISAAIRDLKNNDVLLIAGKGHEQGQSIKGQILSFNDEQMVRDILAKDYPSSRGSK